MKPQTTTKKDDFFDAFNDNFTKSSTIDPSSFKSYKTAFDTSNTSSNNNNSFTTTTSNTNAFGDPFGDKKYGNESTKPDFAAFDDFNDNFGDMKLSTDTTKGFPAFDAFNNNSPGNRNVLKTSNLNSSNNSNRGLGSGYAKPFIKSPLKMQDSSKLPPINISKMDFSKEDTFDLDLAKILERSKIEQ